MKAGECEFCGRYWSTDAGGIDEQGRCPDCRKKFKTLDAPVEERSMCRSEEGKGVALKAE